LRFEVLTAVSTKMAVCWAVAPCRLVWVYQRFKCPYCTQVALKTEAKRTCETLVNIAVYTALRPSRQPSSGKRFVDTQFSWRTECLTCNPPSINVNTSKHRSKCPPILISIFD
jgi:hypothetical protein